MCCVGRRQVTKHACALEELRIKQEMHTGKIPTKNVLSVVMKVNAAHCRGTEADEVNTHL